MPAIAPIEDLRAAQKEGLSIYAMLHAVCFFADTENGHGHVFNGERTPEQLKGERVRGSNI